jgi:hypothetical protein
MGLPIDLDQQSALETSKVRDITCKGELSAKSKALWAFAKLVPKHDLGQADLPTKLASEPDVLLRGTDSAMPDAPKVGPSTMLGMVPLPVPGRIWAIPHDGTIHEHPFRESRESTSAR